MTKFHFIALLPPLFMCAGVAPVMAQQRTGGAAAGLDALDENRVMTELANRGMETLLKREFELNKTPQSQQNGIVTLISIRKLSDPNLRLNPAEKQELVEKISKGIVTALPAIKDPTALMQIAKTLMGVAVDPQVNALEYWGENTRTQSQLRPVVETVLKIYAQAIVEAGKKADEIANKLTAANDDAGAARWQAAEDLRNLAVYLENMVKYDLCLALDKSDPKRKTLAEEAIEALKQFDNNESSVQAIVRNRVAKLNMVTGDYDAARQLFQAVATNPNGEIKPAPDTTAQYEARYFSVVCDILAHKPDQAKKDMDALDSWQKANPADAGVRDEKAAKQIREGVAAAFTMLNYRMLSTSADSATGDARAKFNDQAVGVLMQLLREQPQYRTVIFQQVLTRLPEDADVKQLEPLLLLALQQQAELEYAKPEGQKIDEKAMARGIDAARQIVQRKPGAGLDAATIARSAYVLPYLLERAARPQEAASAFLDYAENFKIDAKNAIDALDHASVLIDQLRKKDIEDQQTRKLFDRFLPIAIAPPYNRKAFAFQYALLLQREGKFKPAIEYFRQVPPDDKRILTARFYQMVALKQRLNDDNDRMPADERKAVMSEVQSLADQVNQQAGAAEKDAAASQEDKKRFSSMLVRTALLAADLASREQKDPKRAIELLRGFEDRVKGVPNEQDVLFQALSLRVNSYMALGKTNDATNTLVTLLKTKQGNEGPALVFDLLKKLDADMDKARAAGDMPQVRQLAQNRAALSGFLVSWASGNSDEKIKALTNRYKVFDASTKQLAAELTEDPAARKAGLEAAMKVYQELFDPSNPDPVVQQGLGFVQFGLGDYKAAKDSLGPLVANKKIGAATLQVMEEGEPKTVENPQYWEVIYKLLRSMQEVARQSPDDAQAKSDLEGGKTFLKQLYVQWPKTIGGKKYHDEYEKLRADLIPEFKPDELVEPPASQPVAAQ